MLALVAGLLAAVFSVMGVIGATPSPEIAGAPGACPVTDPAPGFQPPEPYPPEPAVTGALWYGSPELWTWLDARGEYVQRKSTWWTASEDQIPQQPDITVTWQRLDAPDEPPIVRTGGTNAFTPEEGPFMIAGLDPDTPGCWQVTASYRGAELSYVYRNAATRSVGPDARGQGAVAGTP